MLDEEKRKRRMHLQLESADGVGLASDPEFGFAVVGYFEWGSRIALANYTAAKNPIHPIAPKPAWGWSETYGRYLP